MAPLLTPLPEKKESMIVAQLMLTDAISKNFMGNIPLLPCHPCLARVDDGHVALADVDLNAGGAAAASAVRVQRGPLDWGSLVEWKAVSQIMTSQPITLITNAEQWTPQVRESESQSSVRRGNLAELCCGAECCGRSSANCM